MLVLPTMVQPLGGYLGDQVAPVTAVKKESTTSKLRLLRVS